MRDLSHQLIPKNVCGATTPGGAIETHESRPIVKVQQSPACPHSTGRTPLPFSDQVFQLLLFASGTPVRRTTVRSGTCAPSHPEWRGKYPVPRNPAMRGLAAEHGEAVKADPTISANAMLPKFSSYKSNLPPVLKGPWDDLLRVPRICQCLPLIRRLGQASASLGQDQE